jgi:hypothetical protein
VLPVTGVATLVSTSFYARSRWVEVIVKGASNTGYQVSEAEKKRLEDMFREVGKISLVLLPAYTVFWLLQTYFMAEPTGIFSSQDIRMLYIMLTYSTPMLVIFFLVPVYIQRKRYPEIHLLFRKVIEAAKLKRKGVLRAQEREDLQIMKEDKRNRIEDG